VTGSPRRRRRVRRGQGEVTEWPRGLVAYTPAGPDDAIPSPEEDRVANRLALAARLLSVLRTQGRPVEREIAELAEARAAFRAGDRDRAARTVDDLLGRLDAGGRPA